MLATPELILEAAQPRRLAEVVPVWLRRVPLYAARPQAGMAPNLAADRIASVLPSLPLITKEDIRRDFPRNFLGLRADLAALEEDPAIELEQTSGTSEERTPLLLPRGWWTEQEARALRLNPLAVAVLDSDPQARRVTIVSPVCGSDISYVGAPSRGDRVVGNALFVSLSRNPFLWSEAELARMAAEALEWQPRFLDVDPVYGVVFARYCERRGIRLPNLQFVLASYEFVSAAHRRILERVFRVPVLNLYGSTETGHLLMEEEAGWMKASLETAFLEVVEADGAGVGSLVVTTLTNDYMPLIRYRIGDFVERKREPYGTRYVVHGREADAVLRVDGQRVTVWQIDQVVATVLGIAHYQLLQRKGAWLLRFVQDGAGPAPGELAALREQLRGLLGASEEFTIQATDMVLSESSGKFRLVYPGRSFALAR